MPARKRAVSSALADAAKRAIGRRALCSGAAKGRVPRQARGAAISSPACATLSALARSTLPAGDEAGNSKLVARKAA
jgi:hypothetical protein